VPTDEANPWDDEAPTASPAEATDGAEPEAAAPETTLAKPTAAEPGDATPADADAPAVATDEQDGDEDRRRVLIIAAVAFVIIAAVAFVLTRSSDDKADEATLPGGTETATGGGPTGGGSITIAGTADTFNRDDTTDGLGALPSGAPWVVQSGTWAIQANEAVVTQPDADRRNVVYVATGYPDPQAEVRLTTIANGAGLVFRRQGECNFWAVYAVPQYATWNVEKVIDCERVGGEGESPVYRTITGAPVADGTKVGVVLSGEKVEIVLNGTIALTFEDPDLAGKGQVGLTSRGEGEVAFDDFVAGGPGGQGIVSAATTPEGGEGATTTTTAEGGSTTTTAAGGDGGGGGG
jgi:hypothetical protein